MKVRVSTVGVRQALFLELQHQLRLQLVGVLRQLELSLDRGLELLEARRRQALLLQPRGALDISDREYEGDRASRARDHDLAVAGQQELQQQFEQLRLGPATQQPVIVPFGVVTCSVDNKPHAHRLGHLGMLVVLKVNFSKCGKKARAQPPGIA